MNQFEFVTANRIIFGRGTVEQGGAVIATFGKRVLMVTGHHPNRFSTALDRLQDAGLHLFTFSVSGEPSTETVQRGVEFACEQDCQVVVALGGGSVIDAGKAIAAMLRNAGDLLDYVEVIGAGKSLANPAAPFIAIPTTAGTGSEVTRNAVLSSPEHRVKVSLRSPHMLPRVAIVDPDLTRTLPPAETAATGLDALTQLIEPFVSNRANPMTDSLCVDGMQRVSNALPKAFKDGEEMNAREQMCIGALFGGLALANAGLGAVHGLAGPIGGMFDAPHGAICAALLPNVTEVNIGALAARAPQSEALRRYAKVARLLTRVDNSPAEGAVEALRTLISDLQIPRLSEYGLGAEHFPELVNKASQASSMKANPIVLTAQEIAEILELSL